MMVSTIGLRSITEKQLSHPLSQCKPLPPPQHLPPFSSPPDPGLTMAARQPSSCRPPAVSVPAPRIHAPPHPLPQSALRPALQLAGREHRGLGGQLEFRMELARSDNLTNLEDVMGVMR